MEGVRAGVPCSVELLNYTTDKRPFQHTVNLAPVRAGDGEVVLFRTTSSKVRKLGAANDANTACGGGVRVDGRCDRERLVAGSMPSCASADSARSATSAPPTTRATIPSSRSSRTPSPRRGCPSSWRTRRSTSTSTPPRSPPS